MARCDEGYLCDACGQDVAAITDSDLYLRYILGEVPPEQLPHLRERHIRCNPAMAQFIIDERFPPISLSGPFDKSTLDSAFVMAEEERITRAWKRLQDIPNLGIPVTEYPLEEVRARWT